MPVSTLPAALGHAVLDHAVLDHAVLGHIESCLDSSSYQAAWNAARALPDLRSWRGARERRLAYRLAGHLGAPRLAGVLARLFYREHPQDLQAQLVHLGDLLERRGPLPAWEAIAAAWPGFGQAAAEERAELLCLRAMASSLLRDFEAAAADQAAALALSRRPWIHVQLARCCEIQDRLAEAAAHADEALRLQPRYFPAIARKIDLLRAAGDDQRALLLLFEAAGRVDHPSLFMLMAQLQMDLGYWADADESIRGFHATAPLLPLDPSGFPRIQFLRAELAYRQGHFGLAAELYESVDLPFASALAGRLRQDPGSSRRRLLEVPWQRQHHRTCSPATLTSICRYWRLPAEHLEIAEEICYDGTASHSERRWAGQNGLIHREFTVDWETAVALIDRGVPFALVTSDASSAHIQAVAGYDSFRKSFICRDPGTRQWVELDAETLLEALAPTGPRGLVLLPPAEQGRLEGIGLPDAELFDLYDLIEASLAGNRREAAETTLGELAARAPGHRLELQSRAALAGYDGNAPRWLAVLEAQLALYPQSSRFRLHRLALLGQLGQRETRRSELEQLVEGREDPHFDFLLAGDLAADARQQKRAERLVRSALRAQPEYWQGFAILANLAAGRGDHGWALQLRRWAACLAARDEGPQLGYFQACREAGRVADGLAYLERRAERLGQLAAGPAISLARALESLGRDPEALLAIETALFRRPADPELLADQVGRLIESGRLAEAREQLGRLLGRIEPTAHLSAAARLAEIAGDFAGALSHLQAMLELDPTSVELYHRIFALETSHRGRKAGLDFLAAARRRFPHHVALAELELMACRESGSQEAREVARRLVELDPENAWAWREAAGLSLELGELGAAELEMGRAEQLEPLADALLNLRGKLAEKRGDRSAALACYRQAIENSVDNLWTLERLIKASPDAGLRREQLRWLAPRLERSVDGGALPLFLSMSQRFLPPSETLAILRRLHGERPDLWQAHEILARELRRQMAVEEAQQVLDAALRRFPLQKGLWEALAELQGERRNTAAKRAALLRLLEIDVADAGTRLELAFDYLGSREIAAAREHYLEGIARHPQLAPMHRLGAEISRHENRFGEALAAALKAIELDPNDLEDWRRLQSYAALAGREERALEAARAFRDRRGDAWSWVVVGRLAADPREARRALAKAIELEPLDLAVHLNHAALLCEQGDKEAALRACRPAAYGRAAEGRIPLELRGYSAVLLRELGRESLAFETLKQAIAEDPGYSLGYFRLCSWYLEDEKWASLEEIASRQIAREPVEPSGWGYRAAARLAAGREAEAVADFRQALEVDPCYGYAALQLSKIAEKEGKPAALRALAAVAEHPQEAVFWARLSDLAAACHHPQRAAWLRKLAAEPEATAAELMPLVRTLAAGGPAAFADFDEVAWHDATEAPLIEARIAGFLEAGKLAEAWAYLWPHRHEAEGWPRGARQLIIEEAKRAGRGAAGRMEHVLQHQRDDLRRSDRTWGAMGYFFLAAGRPRDAIAWMADFSERQDASPGDLIHLAWAHLLGKDYARACAVSRHAETLPRTDDTAFHHHLAAWWEAMQGKPERGLALALVPGDPYLDFARLAKAAAAVAGRRGDREALELAWEYLGPSAQPGCQEGFDWDCVKSRMFNKTIYFSARQVRTVKAWFRALLRARSES